MKRKTDSKGEQDLAKDPELLKYEFDVPQQKPVKELAQICSKLSRYSLRRKH